MKLFHVFSMLASLTMPTLGCQEHVTFEDEPDNFWLGIENDNYDIMTTDDYREYDYDEGTSTTTSPRKILLKLIVCQNLRSTEDLGLYYSYHENGFDQHLKIMHSHLHRLRPSSFSNFTTITRLYLTRLRIHTILPGAFNGLTKLQELHLSHNEITELSKGVYNSLHNLKILTLNDNRIVRIENMALMGTDRLVELHLQNNNLEKFTNELFQSQLNVSYLDLSNNPLKTFELEKMTKLLVLNLTNTSLRTFGGDLSFPNLEILNLSDSQLLEFNFENISKVSNLDLARNQIEILKNCQQLLSRNVNISHNNVKIIEGIKHVFFLDLTSNKIEILKNSTFYANSTIVYVNFGFNKISFIENRTFDGLIYLEALSLNNNRIRKIDNALFKDLSRLEFLNLSYNNIETFQYGTFDNLKSLSVLDISDNRLLDLPQNTFNSLSRLNFLLFDNNYISNFDVAHLNKQIRRLQLLSLNGNPWNCERLAKIHTELNSLLIHLKVTRPRYDVENVQGIPCDSSKPETNTNQNSNISPNSQHFFERDFQKSNFVRFFDQNYSQSNFFKYFDNYRTSVANLTTKMKAPPHASSKSFSDMILIFMSIILVFIFLLLIYGLYILYFNKRESLRLSQIELCQN